MTAIPLEGIRLDPQSHPAALWWIGLLYRRPRQFSEAMATSGLSRPAVVGFRLFCHHLPYAVIVCSLGRLVLFGVLGIEAEASFHRFADSLFWHAESIAVGIVIGLVFGVTIGLFSEVATGLAGGMAVGMSLGMALGTTNSVPSAIAFGTAFGIAGGIVAGLVFGIASGTLVGMITSMAAGLDVALAVGVAVGVACSIVMLRAYYLPLHAIFLWPTPKGSWYRYHPVAWDDCCRLGFPGLDRLLVDYHQQNTRAADHEIRRLIDSYPSQRLPAQRARTILVARLAGQSTSLSDLDKLVADLPEGDRGFLGQTRQLREMVRDVSRLQAQLNTLHLETLEHPLQKKILAEDLCREIEQFRGRVAGFHQPLAQEFQAAASRWLSIATKQRDLATRAALEKEAARQVFRAGDPVDRRNEAFVPRDAVGRELERLLMLDTGCPGIVLYGRRRTGKSTLLHNLDVALPNVLSASISMQRPAAFTSLETFVGTLIDLLSDKVKGLDTADGYTHPYDLGDLFQILDDANRELTTAGKRLVLSIDEYENIDRKIGEGVFSVDLLDTVRESIQFHRCITWVLAGRQQITELRHASWPSYLVSARTVEVGPFTETETRVLLTEPMRHSSEWSEGDPSRPRFEPGFWGEGGIERIHVEAGGWPHLVQLIAETVIDLLNAETPRSAVDADLIERALDKAIVRGDTVFSELMLKESTLAGEWDYLDGFRRETRQAPPADATVASSLRRRLLVSEEDGLWRLRVPLMQRWLRQRA